MQGRWTLPRILPAAIAALLLAYAVQPQALADVDNAVLANESGGSDWPAYGRTFSEQRFSPLDQINRQSVANLGLAWSMEQEWNVSSAPRRTRHLHRRRSVDLRGGCGERQATVELRPEDRTAEDAHGLGHPGLAF
jgi:hypothetical protein